MRREARLGAVIFDMDGVIVHSEPLWSEAEQRLLARRGLIASPELKPLLMGRDSREAIAILIKHYELGEQVEDVVRERNQIIARLFQESLEPVPHILNLIHSLREGEIKTAVASSSPNRLVVLALDKLGIKELFDVILSGDEVFRGKPSPEIYLAAAGRLGVKPANCLVIEDAPSGVAAAKAAGMKCLAVCTTVGSSELGDADRVVESFAAVDFTFIQAVMINSQLADGAVEEGGNME
jgi:HAD superfamily hydrolase (TIGR01509 family)